MRSYKIFTLTSYCRNYGVFDKMLICLKCIWLHQTILVCGCIYVPMNCLITGCANGLPHVGCKHLHEPQLAYCQLDSEALILVKYEWHYESRRLTKSGAKMAFKIQYHGPLTGYVKLRVAHAPGMPGTFSQPPRISGSDMHQGTCVTHLPWCVPGSLTSGFFWSRWRGPLCWQTGTELPVIRDTLTVMWHY